MQIFYFKFFTDNVLFELVQIGRGVFLYGWMCKWKKNTEFFTEIGSHNFLYNPSAYSTHVDSSFFLLHPSTKLCIAMITETS